jgi:hypothetical protein
MDGPTRSPPGRKSARPEQLQHYFPQMGRGVGLQSNARLPWTGDKVFAAFSDAECAMEIAYAAKNAL